MRESDRQKCNQKRLSELHPVFRLKIESIIRVLDRNGFRPRIQEAWRSLEDQQRAFDAGRTELLYGFHNVTAEDGTPEALAVDLLNDDAPMSLNGRYVLQLAAAAEEAGLVTGIRWGLSKESAEVIDEAIAHRNWDAAICVGWDPMHVQMDGITIHEVKSRRRSS